MSTESAVRSNGVGDQEHLLRFFVRWAPFDGGDEDIYPSFGINPRTYYLRVADVLRGDASLLPGRDVAGLIDYCERKARKLQLTPSVSTATNHSTS